MRRMTMRFCAFAFVCLLASATFASVTISGNLKDLTGTAVSSRTLVRFTIRGCNGNQPRKAGTAIIVPSIYEFTPNASGVLSGTLYDSLTDIECGGVVGATWYGVTIFRDGKPNPEVAYNVTGTTFNLNSALPNSTNPVVAAPTGDSTYARLDGLNQPFTGNITAPSFIGSLTGNASTATALAANGTNCSAGNYARGVDASGNAENCTLAGSVPTGTGFRHITSGSEDAASKTVDLASSDITGTLAVNHGGTGAATLTNHGVLLGQTTSPIAATGAGTSGQCLTSNGTSADPTFQNCALGGTGATSITVNSATQAATVDLNNSTPVATAGAGYDNSQIQTSTAGSISSVSVQTAIVSHNYRSATWSSTGFGSGMFGDDSYSGSSTGNHSPGSSTDPPYSQLTTSTTNGNAVAGSGQASWRVGHGLYMWAKLKISSTTAVRYAIGFESNSNGGAGGSFNVTTSDTFNGLFYVGFLYSTTLSHTQWQCVKNNQAANITVAGSPTTAPDTTAWHVYEVIEESSGTFGCYIDGVKIASSLASGITSGIPLNSVISVTCLTCTPTANNIKFSKVFWAATY